MKLLYDIKKGEYINDFQSSATDQGLDELAKKMNLESYEIRDMSEQEFKQIDEDMNGKEREKIKKQEDDLLAQGRVVQGQLSLTDDELKALKFLLNHI